ncbi:MAG: glycerate kinase [Nitrospira sp.]|jgi:glycerate 2-kinase|nr:glycerate kinase [Nitrospira sp.]
MRLQIPASPARSVIARLIRAGLEASDPALVLPRIVRREGHILHVGRRRYDLRSFDRVVVVGAGKAAARMVQALERVVGPRLEGGLVVVKKGHRVPTRRVTVMEAGHPIPDRAGLKAAVELRKHVASCGARDLLFVVISGGASSLIPAPVPGVHLADKRRMTELLLRSGATIHDINIVRKHLSAIKGGRLAESTTATMVTLILSDVIGDDLASIGSGPTMPDPSSFQDAIAVLKRYRLWATAPDSIREYLARGRQGVVRETPKPGARFRRVQHEIIGNNAQALAAIEAAARQAGLRTVLFSTALVGEAAQEGEDFAALAERLASGKGMLRRPCCVVAGGEPTVTVTGHGKGGRAQEFAVAAARKIGGLPNIWIAAVGTDGTDGPTDVAGAVVSGGTLEQAKEKGISLRRALLAHDTYRALKSLKSHIVTGPTGTNVNDLYILLAL